MHTNEMNYILILYAEVMPYNVAAYESLIRCRPDIELDVISWGTDKKLTPFMPPSIDRVNYYNEKDFDLDALIKLDQERKYKLIYICGRMEKKYLDFALYKKKKNRKCLVIGQTDEQFYGNFKQLIVKLFSYFLYKRYFDKIFVPGFFQYEYMRYIGFKKSQILIGAYTANIGPFNQFYINNSFIQNHKNKELKLLYLGRLEKEKGILQLTNTISSLNDSLDFRIILKVIGNGSLLPDIINFEFIEYYKFADHDSIIKLLSDIDFFILPSVYEPWGVVLHEMAAAGMPIICSEECGARSAMVINNYNGFIFKSNHDDSLKQVLINAFNISEKRFTEFKKRSYELSKSITPDVWAETISSFVS